MTRIVRSALLALLLATAGCRTWSLEPLPTSDGPVRSGEVRVYAFGREMIEMEDARIVSESLVGVVRSSDRTSSAEISIPTRDIATLAIRRVSPRKSLVVLGGVGIALVTVADLLFGFWGSGGG